MGNEATFPIVIDSNAAQAGRDGASALEQLRQKILGSTTAIREMQAAQSRLRGSTTEINAARDQLKAKIDAERSALTKAQLELQKTGVSYEKLAAEARKASAATEGGISPAGRVGKALEGLDIVGKKTFRDVNDLKEAFGGMSTGAQIGAVAVTGLVLVLAALAAAAVAGGAALLKFIVEGANAARTANLTSEAMAGGAANAKALASQVDALAAKVPQSREELTKLADELALSGLRGDKFVDTLNAVAQTAGAVGEAAGNKLKTALEKANKGQLLTPEDFEGTGLDVAGVKLEGGAKAIREAVEKQFGGINARKMLDLQVIATKFKDSLNALTRDVNLERLLNFAKSIADMFDQSTVSGEAIHQLVTAIGDGFSNAVGESTPFVKTFLKGMVIGALEAGIVFLQLRRTIKETFGDDSQSSVDGMKLALEAGKLVAEAFAVTLAGMYGAFRLLSAVVTQTVEVFNFFGNVIGNLKQGLTQGWDAIGGSIVSGLIGGITGGASQLVGAVGGLATKVKDGFKSALGIHSPSTVFAEFGQHTAEGFEQGVSAGADGASQAVNAMGAQPAAASGGGGNGVNVNFNITIAAGGGAGGGGGGDKGAAEKLQSPGFLSELQRTIEELLVREGIPVGA